MGLDSVHWFVTPKCNLNCNGCFRPREVAMPCHETALRLAKILAENRVKKVVFGGGEPLLVPWIEEAGRILREGGAYVAVHTNGVLLSPERIERLSSSVNGIAVPIDSTDEQIQANMRGKAFIHVLKRIPEIARQVKGNALDLGFHTYFTNLNKEGIPRIYKFIDKLDFDSWRIYEYNEDLARKSLSDSPGSEHNLKAFERMEILRGIGTPEKGGTDCFFAKFLLMEEEMRRRYKDKRVQFVAVREPKQSYTFVDNNGEAMFYAWFSGNERRGLGNLFRDGFDRVNANWTEMDEKEMAYDKRAEEDWVAAKFGDVPLWARTWEGAYGWEELEEVRPRYYSKFHRLERLFKRRTERLERSLAA